VQGQRRGCHHQVGPFHSRKMKECKAWLPLTGPENEYTRYPLTPNVNPNLNVIPPGLACSHTAVHNSLRRRGPPLVMCVSVPAEIPPAGADRLVTANPCQPTRTRSSSSSPARMNSFWRYSKKHRLNRAYSRRLSFLSCCSDPDASLVNGDSPGDLISFSNLMYFSPASGLICA
jgi:hypothetical protein